MNYNDIEPYLSDKSEIPYYRSWPTMFENEP